MKPNFLWIAGLAVALGTAAAQQNNADHEMTGAQMPGHDMSDMNSTNDETGGHAMHSMEDHHMALGPHMKMTALRTPQPGDEKKAEQVVEAARQVMEKYKDYQTAL